MKTLTLLGVIAFCYACWAGIFWLIGAGWGWHVLVAACLIALGILVHEPATYTGEYDERRRY